MSGTSLIARELAIPTRRKRLDVMDEMSQLASAMVTLIFAAGMLVAGQLYMERRSAQATAMPAAQLAALQNPSRENPAVSAKTSHAFRPPQFRHRRQ